MTMKTAMSSTSQHALRHIVGGVLGVPGERLRPASPLLGGAGLDSMAVMAVVAAIEDYFGIAVDDNLLSAHHFATVGSLTEFVQEMLPP